MMMTTEHKDHWPWDSITEGSMFNLTHAVIINIDALTQIMPVHKAGLNSLACLRD